jgi:hypothetical protein
MLFRMTRSSLRALGAWSIYGLIAVGCSGSEKPTPTPKSGAQIERPKATATTATAAKKSSQKSATPSISAAKKANIGKYVPPKKPMENRDVAQKARSFLKEAKLLYQLVACPTKEQAAALAEPLPTHLAKLAREHCKKRIGKLIETYHKRYASRVQSFLEKKKPVRLPTTIVYPFGGGDLMTALTTYPNAKEITTISLEHAGELATVAQTPIAKLRRELSLLRSTVLGLLAYTDSKSTSMMKMQITAIPGQLAFFLIGMRVHGFVPTSAHYFWLDEKGEPQYLTQAKLDSLRPKKARKLSIGWVHPRYSEGYSNVELRFARPDGSDPRLHRHIAANLNNQKLEKDGPLLTHLKKKGQVASMTKAAAYLLWRGDFSHIRNYLLANMLFMVSDSTGIPPRIARRRGFVQHAYGRYVRCFFEKRFNPRIDKQFIRLWRKNRRGPLPFRYGYPDHKGNYHMMITRRRGS